MGLFDLLKKVVKKKEILDDQTVLNSGKHHLVDDLAKKDRVFSLTAREKDIYLLLLEGYTLKEVAQELGIKYSTANTHMTGIYRKLGVNTRAELIINYRDIR